MNAPVLHRSILKHHVATLEAHHPIKILGLLPRGAAAHRFEENALDFLAEKREGLDLFGLASAENDLEHLLGQPVGIVLVSGLQAREAVEFPTVVQPL